ncbi:hypothetical protein SAM23877_6163 [Streptomyces ambofaciens ATCC 23877]|uniref:Uncharacterized protein n=1 Tax=Streptomyces ambofaciens (strain ATCC 23877 / 3486 / DSM 40053 / JCM 4204 / NBRC 12836 / NRRL B-2516) TaxID=278992 RepID=A0A0K2B1X7_STRA7|nr:hypothetical protein [Streptomyces ambofaciens]AKZ59208.1 hypothetical protein SAM23877_6163 [Streptomyces ambofaciens ATCC 23877]WNA15401.1 hypothetical protein SAMYPH_70 [Streptomyces phage Samy]
MTEHIATCRWAAADHLRAQVSGDAVHIEHRTNHTINGDVSLRSDAARTFARGILALADEIDGGEAEEVPALSRTPKVGDRVRVVRNAYSFEGAENIGRVGVLKEVTPEDAQSHRVSFTDDAYGWWCAEVEYVESAPADSRPKVGDRFRVTQDFLECAGVHVGDIVAVGELTGDESFRTTPCADGRRWHFGFSSIGDGLEPVTDEPAHPLDEPGLAGWERDLIESASPPAPIKVGDLVTIVRAEYSARDEDGRTGIVDEVDDNDDRLPYRIVDEAGDFVAWAAEVRKVDEPEDATPSPFARYVDEAKKLLAGTDHTGTDVIALARELSEHP